MAEKLSSHESREQHKSPEKDQEQLEKLSQSVEKGEKAKHEQKDQIEAIRASIEEQAEKAPAKTESETTGQEQSSSPIAITRSLKNQAYRKELAKVRKRLSKPEKVLSKAIHSKGLERASEIGAQTVARPSGLLGGGLCALLGSGILVWMARYYGFEYNFFVFILFLVAGFILGVTAELVIKTFRKKA